MGSPSRCRPWPRLHAALLCAAGFGPRAVSTGPDSLDIREEDQAALRWLEENPRDSVAIPALQINLAYPVAYRDDGTIKRSEGSASIKKLPRGPAVARPSPAVRVPASGPNRRRRRFAAPWRSCARTSPAWAPPSPRPGCG